MRQGTFMAFSSFLHLIINFTLLALKSEKLHVLKLENTPLIMKLIASFNIEVTKY